MPTFALASIPHMGAVVALVLLFGPAIGAQRVAAPQSAALRIVVIAGEDAVNVIQQKTAVAPIVEVRDRNDQPVAGAVVNFAIRSGRASFGGARTLAVTTDALGRAVATGLTPTGTGALQIGASATFQGQTAAAVTITQTNVLTAAQAAAASSAAASGGGGGLSGTTLGITAAAAGGVALSAAVLGAEPTASAVSNPTPAQLNLSGPYSGVEVETHTYSTGGSCTFTYDLAGTVTMTLQPQSDGNVTGTAAISGTKTAIVVSGPPCTIPTQNNGGFVFQGAQIAVSGPATQLTFSRTSSGTTPSLSESQTLSFSGALQGGSVSGTLTYSRTLRAVSSVGGVVTDASGSITLPVTLR